MASGSRPAPAPAARKSAGPPRPPATAAGEPFGGRDYESLQAKAARDKEEAAARRARAKEKKAQERAAAAAAAKRDATTYEVVQNKEWLEQQQR